MVLALAISQKELDMQTGKKAVKSAKNVVGTARFPVYETVEEAVEGIGAQTLLDKLNAQIQTDAMNQVRALATGTPSKESLTFKALGMIPAVELAAAVGDEAKMRELIAKKVAELKAEQSAEGAKAPVAPEADEDEDEDDD